MARRSGGRDLFNRNNTPANSNASLQKRLREAVLGEGRGRSAFQPRSTQRKTDKPFKDAIGRLDDKQQETLGEALDLRDQATGDLNRIRVPVGGGSRKRTGLITGGQGANDKLDRSNKLIGDLIAPPISGETKAPNNSGRGVFGPRNPLNTDRGPLDILRGKQENQIEENTINRNRTVAFTRKRSKLARESQRIAQLVLTGRRNPGSRGGSTVLPRGLALLGQRSRKVL